MKRLILFCSLGFLSFCSNAQTAIDLAGTGNQVDVTVPALSEFTIEFDFYMHSLLDWNAGITQTSGAFAAPVDFYVNATGGVTFFVDDAVSYSGGSIAGLTLVPGNWYHIAYSVGASTSKVYIDGVLVYTVGSAPDTDLTSFIIGDRADGAINADAKYDNIRVWSDVRTDAEIADNFNVCLTGTEANLSVLFNCEEGAGTTLIDLATGDGSQNGLVSGTGTWTSGVLCCPEAQTLSTSDFTVACAVDTTITLAGSESGMFYLLRDTSNYYKLDGLISGTGAALGFSAGSITETIGMEVVGFAGTKQDFALDFDGIDDHINAGNTFGNFDAATDFTVEANIKYSGTAPDFSGIYAKAGDPAPLTGFQLVLVDDKIAAEVYGGGASIGTGDGLIGTTLLNDGEWHHVAIVCSRTSTSIRLYVDGLLEAEVIDPVAAADFTNIADAKIGTERGNVFFFPGTIDEVRVWHSARTQKELNENIHLCIDLAESDLEAYFKLEDGTGSLVATELVAGNDGALVAMDASTDWVSSADVYCDACLTQMGDILTITIDPLLDQPITTGDFTTLCQVDTTIELSSSQNGIAYFLRDNLDNSVIEGPQIGTGSSLSFNPPLITTTSSYNVFSSSSSTGLDFDGVDDFINIPVMDLSGSNEMTIEVWVKPSDITTESGYTITRQEDFGFGPEWLLAFQGSGTILAFGLRTTGGYSELDATIDPAYFTDGKWHHIAAVYDGSNKHIYVDGVEIGTEVKTGNITFIGSLNLIGNSYSGGVEYYTGEMDELRIWSTAKSSSELDVNKVVCLTGSETGLHACYSFEDGTGSVITADKTGAFNGTLTNMDPSTDWIDGAYVCGDCDLELSDVVTVTIENLVSQTVNTADYSTYCLADTLVEVDGSQVGANYYLRDDADNSIVDGPIAGTGAAITLSTGMVNATTTFNVYTTTQNDKSIDLPASNDYMRTNAPYTAFTSEITVETWVYSPVAGNDVWGGQASTVDAMATNVWIFDENAFFVNDNGTWRAASWASTPIPAGWTHVACVSDATSTRVYFNGVEVGSGLGISTGIQSNPAAVLDLGQDPRFAPGTIGRNSDVRFDNFRIWDYARTDAEINAAMNLCLDGTESGLVQYMEFNEGYGTGVSALTGGDGIIENPTSNRGDGIQSCPDCDVEALSTVTITIETETITSESATICEGDSILLAGEFQTMAGVYNDTLTSVDGCDSIISTTLSVDPILYESLDFTICEGDSLFLGGAYQTVTGSYMDTLSSMITGCDSVITSNLTVNAILYSSFDYSICSGDSLFLGGSYQTTTGVYMDTVTSSVTGCDSIITSNLTVDVAIFNTLTFDICDGDSVYAEGAYQFMTGVYMDTLSSAFGCDSIVTTNVNVAAPVNINVTLSGIDLMAGATGTGVTYQWIDCSDSSDIAGATNQSFTPSVDGDYAVIVDDNGCVDTSDCTTVAGVGISTNESDVFTIYPNPSNGMVKITFTAQPNQYLEIYNVQGSKVYADQLQGNSIELDLSHLESGVYLVLILSQNSVSTQKLIMD